MRILRVEPWNAGVDHSHGNPNSSFYFPSSRDSGPYVLCPGLWSQRKGAGLRVEIARAKPTELEQTS